jgi:hypothetical protein
LTRRSKSESGGFCADGFGDGAGLAFSEGKIEFSVSQSSAGRAGEPIKMMLLLGKSRKNFLSKKGLVV